MATYEAGTKVAVCIKQENPDEDDVCNSKTKGTITTKGKSKINEGLSSVNGKEQTKNNNENGNKSSTENKAEENEQTQSANFPQNSFAQTNKFSIFNLLNTKHRKPSSVASCTTSSSSALEGASSSTAPHAAPACLPSTSRDIPATGPLQLKRSPSLQLFTEEEDEEEEGWLRLTLDIFTGLFGYQINNDQRTVSFHQLIPKICMF